MKKYLFHLIIAITTLVIAFSSCSSSGGETVEQVIRVTGVTLNKDTIELRAGDTETIVATVRPNNATNKTLTWASSNTSVAAVSNSGDVTAISTGVATITVTTQDGGKKAECTLTVLNHSDTGVDVYVAGGYDDDGLTNAVLWKNGVIQHLTYSQAESVFVSDGDVYAAGHDFIIPTLWKNGVAQHLSDYKDYTGQAYSVFVSGKDVYVAGYEMSTENLRCFPTLWKNGVAQHLSEGSIVYLPGACALSVFVSDGDVYVAGFEKTLGDGMPVATVWKNGIAQYLTDHNNPSMAYSVFVSGDDVYVAGCDSRTGNFGGYLDNAVLWKNGVAQQLGGYEAHSVFVSGKDVYVAGSELNILIARPVAILWKNGVAQRLGSGDYYSAAASVFVSGRDVYVAGFEVNELGNTVATVWKNGIPHRLSSENEYTAAFSVFVRETQ